MRFLKILAVILCLSLLTCQVYFMFSNNDEEAPEAEGVAGKPLEKETYIYDRTQLRISIYKDGNNFKTEDVWLLVNGEVKADFINGFIDIIARENDVLEVGTLLEDKNNLVLAARGPSGTYDKFFLPEATYISSNRQLIGRVI